MILLGRIQEQFQTMASAVRARVGAVPAAQCLGGCAGRETIPEGKQEGGATEGWFSVGGDATGFVGKGRRLGGIGIYIQTVAFSDE